MCFVANAGATIGRLASKSSRTPAAVAHVGGGRGDRDQRQHCIAFLDVIFDPLLVDRDVTLEEVEALFRQQVRDALALHVHAVDLPVGRGDDALRQMVADEAVDAEDQYFWHGQSF